MSTQEKTQKISHRGAKIEASITMAVTALANQLKEEGKSIIGMSAGEPDFDTPDSIKQAAIQAIQDGQTKYTAAAGLPRLKQAICNKFKRDHDLDYTPDQVIVSCGAKHTIYNILMAIINPGDEVIIPRPYWVSYPDQVQLANGTPVFLDTSDKTQFKITPEQLESAITSKTKCLILNSPSNPTGMVYSREELQALGEILVKHQCLVISDEIYEKLIYDGTHVSIASLSPELKNLSIVVNGASKAYSMTGWRIGYCAGPKDIVSVMGRIQSHSTSNPTTPAQFAAIQALEGCEQDVEKMRQAFEERRQLIVSKLNSLDGVTCLTPQGAFYAFPNISGLFGKTSASGQISDSVSFCKQLLQEKLVACVPGSGFGAEGYIRLSYATSQEAITEAIQRLDDWIQTLR